MFGFKRDVEVASSGTHMAVRFCGSFSFGLKLFKMQNAVEACPPVSPYPMFSVGIYCLFAQHVFSIRLEAIAIRLEAIAISRLEAIAIRTEEKRKVRKV